MSGIDAYKKALNKTASSRNAEYRLLAQVTAALIEAKEADGDMRKNPAKMKMLAHALNWNNEVWSTFMDDCRSEDNKLPEKLRGGILSLGIWVNKETQAALNGDVGLDALISVNRDIMKGLDDATTVKTDSKK
ncbi:MAG: flagellar biosynthesis regulator FlaF [Pseudomonadota bacterium]|jgi:flagellar protein FlaF|nr:flagellar biosynthesis regulator FlaF [Pseudomonadota bacterium]|tara:strand:- start:25 stop:423 length:399 start_codon:yes stop_codon:yes gene_type:complete